jgi:hypothetical protein
MASHELHFRIVSFDRVPYADAQYFVVVRGESGNCTSQILSSTTSASGTTCVPFNFVSQLSVSYNETFSIELFLLEKGSNNSIFLCGQTFTVQSFNSGGIYDSTASLVGQNVSCSMHYRIQLMLPGAKPLYNTPQPGYSTPAYQAPQQYAPGYAPTPMPPQPAYAAPGYQVPQQPQPVYAPGYPMPPQPVYAPGYAPAYAPGYPAPPMYYPPPTQTIIIEENNNRGMMGGMTNGEAAILGLAVGAALF